nr:hypothetical protein GCM10025732_03880 [Glycomyces mayteni]
MEAALPPRHWVDRSEVLEAVIERLTAPERSPVAVFAQSGTGKTALMLKIAELLRERFPDGQIFIDLSAERPVSAMRSVLMRLGEPSDRLSDSLGALLSHYRSITSDKTLLVMVDGVDRAKEAMLFQPSSRQSSLLLNAEHRLDDPDLQQFELSELDPADAALLLQRLCPWIEASESGALVEVHGGSPAKVRRLAGLMRARRHRNGRSETGVLASYSPERVLNETFKALSPSAAWLSDYLSALPGEEFEQSMLSIFRTPDDAHSDAFEELVNAQLVSESHPGRYRLEPFVIRDANRARGARSLPVELFTAMHQTLRWYLRRARLADEAIMGDRLRLGVAPDDIRTQGFTDSAEALNWFERNHHALLNAMRIAALHGWRTEAWSLAESMWAFYTNAPHPKEAERCYRLAAVVADSARAESRILSLLGKTLTDQGRFGEADEVLIQALALAQDEGDLALMGTATELRGRLLHKQGRPDEAVEVYQAALANARTRGRARSEAWQLLFLGQAHVDIDDSFSARGYFEKALDKFVEAEDARTAAMVRFELAMLDLAEEPGATEEALKAIGWMHRLGLAVHEARFLERLGNALGEDEGKRYLEQALEIYEDIGDVDGDRLRRQLLQH